MILSINEISLIESIIQITKLMFPLIFAVNKAEIV